MVSHAVPWFGFAYHRELVELWFLEHLFSSKGTNVGWVEIYG
jgi:hypothetical protein